MPRDPVDPAADSNGTSQPLSRTHDNIQPRLDLISRTGTPLRLKSGRSFDGAARREPGLRTSGACPEMSWPNPATDMIE